MKRFLNIFIPVLLCMFTGWASSYFMTDAIYSWYPTLNKPAFTPPDMYFPLIWTILYICMGVSLGVILNSKSLQKGYFIVLFGIHLFFSFLWGITFFYMENPWLGVTDIIILDLVVIYYSAKAFRVSSIAGYWTIPYVLWLLFATYINVFVAVCN